jgi:putative pyoverdin transport system ATP-binding/permease protein
MSLLRFLLRESRGAVALSTLAGIVAGTSGVALIALIHADLAREHPPTRTLGWAFAALVLVLVVSRVVSQAAMVRLGQASVHRMCVHLCRKILSMPLERFEELDPSALVAVLTEDVVIVSGALAGLPQVCVNGPVVVICAAYVGWLSPLVLACGLGGVAVAILGHGWLAQSGLRHLKRARASQDALVDHFRSLIGGFRELKANRRRREAFLAEHLEPAAAEVRDGNTAGLVMFWVASGWGQLAFFGFIGFLLFALPALHDPGRDVLAGAVLVVLYVMSPLEGVQAWMPALSRARVSLLKIEALDPSLSAGGRDAAPDATAGRPAFREALELSGVSYAYRHGPDRDGFALGPVDLTLRPEELVFLVGGNGSGKTTLVKLLTGLYAPQAGAIRLDGRLVTAGMREGYRQLFSTVFADGHLFKALMGLDASDLDARARDELVRLELDGPVRVEGGAFSTTTELSLGQRKRLALLAACLLEDRPICVLDEWASHQDPRFKKIFYLEILPELRARGKSILVITHDEDYFHAADRVIRLDSGRILDHNGALDAVPDHCV